MPTSHGSSCKNTFPVWLCPAEQAPSPAGNPAWNFSFKPTTSCSEALPKLPCFYLSKHKSALARELQPGPAAGPWGSIGTGSRDSFKLSWPDPQRNLGTLRSPLTLQLNPPVKGIPLTATPLESSASASLCLSSPSLHSILLGAPPVWGHPVPPSTKPCSAGYPATGSEQEVPQGGQEWGQSQQCPHHVALDQPSSV